MFRHCLDPKFIAIVVIASIAVIVYLPGALANLPLLLFVLCPLFMLLLLWAFGGDRLAGHGGGSRRRDGSPADLNDRRLRLSRLEEKQRGHGSTYTHAGVRVYGPAPRSMDKMELTFDASGSIIVNMG